MSLDNLDPKDPDDKVNYHVDWTRYLNRIGNTITSSSWPVIAPSGITPISNTHDGLVATIKVGGGTAGTDYRLTNRIITAPDGLQRDHTITVRVKNL